MKISDMRQLLTQMEKRIGNVEVYFDCPKCLVAFAPDSLVKEAAHLTAEKEKK